MTSGNVSGNSLTERHMILLITTLTESHLVILMAAAYLGVKNSVNSCHLIAHLSCQWTKPQICITCGLNNGLVSEDITFSRFGGD